MTDDQFGTLMGVLYDIRNLLAVVILAAGLFLGFWLWDFAIRMFSYGNFLTRE